MYFRQNKKKSLSSAMNLMKRNQECVYLFLIYVLLICISYFNSTHIATAPSQLF